MAAESVGLAASIGGIVSLGLTITGGIIKYVDAFENRQEELNFVSRQNEALKAVLLALERHLSSHGQSAALPDAVAQGMQLFEGELNHVKALHSDLADSHPQSWTSRLKNRKKRVTYAFNRSKIQELGLQLQKAGDALQLTLNVLGLQVLKKSTDTLAAVESSSQDISSELSTVRSELAAIEMPIIKIEDQLSLLRGGVNSNTQLLGSRYEALAVQVQGSRNDLRDVQETTDAIQRLAQLQSMRDQEMTKQYEEMNKNISEILGHIQQSDVQILTREAVVRGLAGKPALLKKLSDEVESLTQTPVQLAKTDQSSRPSKISKPLTRPYPLKSTVGRVCTCPRLQSATKSKWAQLGHASFSGDWETIAHWPGCPMEKINSKQRMTMCFKYNGLVHMLKTAVDVSFTMTSGAGGFSISPSFTCSPTVDVDFDPAFRIIYLISEGLLRLEGKYAESFMMACMTRLSRLLDDGKVCATAVDLHNMSLMHHTISSIDLFCEVYCGEKSRGTIRSLFLELVQMLLSYGVAAFSFDLNGLSPLVMPPSLFACDISQAVTKILIQANSDGQPLVLDTSYIECDYRGDGFSVSTTTPVPTMSVKSLYKVYSGFAEVTGCGPLSIAVIQDDCTGVENILKCTPGSVAEMNVFGQTPFHLAAANHPILEILLEYGDCDILDRRDLSGFTALEIAMMHTSDICDNRQKINECNSNECDCCLCVDLLLGAECSVRMHKLAATDCAWPALYVFLTKASERARQKYVRYMARRPLSIKRSPSSSPYADPYASTKSNDCRSATESEIAQVEKATTSLSGQRKFNSMPDVADDKSWVFLEIGDSHLAALFYENGFQPHPFCLNHLQQMNYAYLAWLVSHGVDPFSRSSKGPAPTKNQPNVGLFGAHFAFYFISLRLRDSPSDIYSWRPAGYWDAFMALAATVCRHDLTDGCECHCTIDGCSPFTWMMKGSSLFFNLWGPVFDIEGAVNVLVSFYSRCSLELTSLTYEASIRYATFEALGLVHTCCKTSNLAHYTSRWVERDDVDIVIEEQAALLKVLEVLVKEFEEKALEFVKANSSENCPFSQFWVLCWKVRIEEELEKLEGKELTDEERRGAEEIGVRWQVSQQEAEKGNPYNRKDPEYWFYELDQICPEYVELWPEELR